MKKFIFLLALLPVYICANDNQQHQYQRLTEVVTTRGTNNTDPRAALFAAGIPGTADSDEEHVYIRDNHSNDNQIDLYAKQQPRVICVLALGSCAFIGGVAYYFYHLIHQHQEN